MRSGSVRLNHHRRHPDTGIAIPSAAARAAGTPSAQLSSARLQPRPSQTSVEPPAELIPQLSLC